MFTLFKLFLQHTNDMQIYAEFEDKKVFYCGTRCEVNSRHVIDFGAGLCARTRERCSVRVSSSFRCLSLRHWNRGVKKLNVFCTCVRIHNLSTCHNQLRVAVFQRKLDCFTRSTDSVCCFNPTVWEGFFLFDAVQLKSCGEGS